MKKIDKLKEAIEKADNIVVLTGAGVSTESGIKDFRGKDGISKYTDIPIERLISRTYFNNFTSNFYEYYKKCFNCLDKKPNITHKFLKKLEDSGKLKAIITQNVDGLDIKAGCKNVLELHGSIYRNYCQKCGKKYDASYVFNAEDIPECSCGGIIKPDVVLYEEQLPEGIIERSIDYIRKADLLLVLGTSLVVYPAAGLVNYFRGDTLAIINYDETGYDEIADIVINDKLSNVIKKLMV